MRNSPVCDCLHVVLLGISFKQHSPSSSSTVLDRAAILLSEIWQRDAGGVGSVSAFQEHMWHEQWKQQPAGQAWNARFALQQGRSSDTWQNFLVDNILKYLNTLRRWLRTNETHLTAWGSADPAWGKKICFLDLWGVFCDSANLSSRVTSRCPVHSDGSLLSWASAPCSA